MYRVPKSHPKPTLPALVRLGDNLVPCYTRWQQVSQIGFVSVKQMKFFFSLSLVLVTVAFLTACGGSAQTGAAKELVPSNANLIAQVQVAKLLQDADLQSLYQQAPKGIGEAQSFNELMDMVHQETGVDFRQFTSAVLFGDVTKDEEYFGIIARGQINEEQIVSAIEESGDYVPDTMDYAGQQIYFAPEGSDTPAMAFLGDDTLALGTLPAVQDVIDVRQGNLDPISGKVYDTFNDLGDPLFSMAMQIPPEALADLDDSFGGGQGFGMMPAMNAFRDLDVLSLILDKPGNDLKVEATLDFFTAESASKMNDTLDGFLKLAAGFGPDKGTRMMVENLELSVNGNRLTVKFQAPVSEVRKRPVA
jgi:hypothetical protein